MASNNRLNSSSGLPKSEPKPPGQGTSYHARRRRHKAAAKAAAAINNPEVTPDSATSALVPPMKTNDMSDAILPVTQIPATTKADEVDSSATAQPTTTMKEIATHQASSEIQKADAPIQHTLNSIKPTSNHNNPTSGAQSIESVTSIMKGRKIKAMLDAKDNGWVTIPMLDKTSPHSKKSPSPPISRKSAPSKVNANAFGALVDATAIRDGSPDTNDKASTDNAHAAARITGRTHVRSPTESKNAKPWAAVCSSRPAPAVLPSPFSSTAKVSSHPLESTKPQQVPMVTESPINLLPAPPTTSTLVPVSYGATARLSPPSPSVPTTVVADSMPEQKVDGKVSESAMRSAVDGQKLDNFLEMIRQAREDLLQGPRVTVFVGTVAVVGIFKRVAMALSKNLNAHFSQNPESDEYHFPANYLDPDAVRTLLVTWVRDNSRKFEAYAVPMHDTFAENVALLRASRMLGMETYTKHILHTFVDYLKNELPSYEEMVIVERNATSDKDPLWTAIVNHLCHERYKKYIPDPEVFQAFLDQHPRLKKAMTSADAYFQADGKKYEAKEAEWRAHEGERRARREKYQEEKRAQIAKEYEAATSPRKKMDAKVGSGLMFATAEEAEWLRSR